jgi:hypothetical protein
VFVFTANGQVQYVFRSEHKNKKKQWVRYLNEAAAGSHPPPRNVATRSPRCS